MKAYRQSKIMAIVECQNIETQEDLTAALRQQNIEVTQATVSRDIKELALVKVQYGKNKYRYASPKSVFKHNVIKEEESGWDGFRNVVNSIDYGGNLLVVKCQPGTGSLVALTIDRAEYFQVLGTVAGDDTVLVVTKNEAAAKNMMNHLSDIIGKSNAE